MKTLQEILLEKLKISANKNVINPVVFEENKDTIIRLCQEVISDDKLYEDYYTDGYKFIEDYLDMSAFKNCDHNIIADITSALANIIESILFIYRIEYIGSKEDYVLKVVDNQYVLYYIGTECRKAPISYKYFLPGYEYLNHLKYGYDSTDLVTYGISSDLPGFIFAKTKERLLQLIADLNEDPYYIDYGGYFDEDYIIYIDDYDNDNPNEYSEDRYTDTKEKLDDVEDNLAEYVDFFNELIDEL